MIELRNNIIIDLRNKSNEEIVEQMSKITKDINEIFKNNEDKNNNI